MRHHRVILGLLILGLVALIALPHFAERYYIQLVNKIMVIAILAMSLDLLVGYTGLVSLGHAAFFGFSGYALALLVRDADIVSLWLTLPICLAATALVALVIGWLAIRTSGVYFIMITLAFGQMLYFMFNDHLVFGGSDGMYVNTRPTASVGGYTLLNLRNRVEFYYFTLFSLVATYVLLHTILRAPFGQVINAIRLNEPRTRALGYATQRYKLVSFVIAGTLAGLAGYLNAVQFAFVNPAHLGWRESGHALIIVILGGMGTLFGPVLGAFVLILLEDVAAALTEHWLLAMGVFIIAVVLLLPDGIAGTLMRAGALKPAAFSAKSAAEQERKTS